MEDLTIYRCGLVFGWLGACQFASDSFTGVSHTNRLLFGAVQTLFDLTIRYNQKIDDEEYPQLIVDRAVSHIGSALLTFLALRIFSRAIGGKEALLMAGSRALYDMGWLVLKAYQELRSENL